MDNTAPGSFVQQEPTQGNQPVPQQPVTPVAHPPATRPMEAPRQLQPQPAAPVAQTPTPQPPVGISPRPESGPVATVAQQDADDEQPVVVQEAPVMQQSHPEVLMPQEVADVGVEMAHDADKKNLPEEKQTFTEAGDLQQPVIAPVQQVDDVKLAMTLEEAKQAAKKTHSIRSGLAWIIKEFIRQWKKKEVKDDL